MPTTCVGCGRRFDLLDPADAEELVHGHGCGIES